MKKLLNCKNCLMIQSLKLQFNLIMKWHWPSKLIAMRQSVWNWKWGRPAVEIKFAPPLMPPGWKKLPRSFQMASWNNTETSSWLLKVEAIFQPRQLVITELETQLSKAITVIVVPTWDWEMVCFWNCTRWWCSPCRQLKGSKSAPLTTFLCSFGSWGVEKSEKHRQRAFHSAFIAFGVKILNWRKATKVTKGRASRLGLNWMTKLWQEKEVKKVTALTYAQYAHATIHKAVLRRFKHGNFISLSLSR